MILRILNWIRIKTNKFYTRCYIKLSGNILNREYSTSESDNGEYPAFCKLAANREKLFRSFKRNAIYNEILEHISYEQGKQYLLNAIVSNQFSQTDYYTFFQNDKVGGPRVYDYSKQLSKVIPSINGHILVSPTTLRYIKVLSDILLLFDMSDIKRITEIGIGYGGQCRILCSKIQGVTYSLVDLPEVLCLAKRYLSEYKISSSIEYIDGTSQIHMEPSDLIISNYAFSELKKDVQDKYIQSILLKAKKGYITYNYAPDNYTPYDICELIGGRIIEEQPKTGDGNCIIVWGTDE